LAAVTHRLTNSVLSISSATAMGRTLLAIGNATPGPVPRRWQRPTILTGPAKAS